MTKQTTIKIPELGVVYTEGKPIWLWVAFEITPDDEEPLLVLGVVDAFSEEDARETLAEQLGENCIVKMVTSLRQAIREFGFIIAVEEKTLTGNEE